MKFGISQYWKPTPNKIRKLADSLVAATTFSGSAAIINDHPNIGMTLFITGFISKTISNFFSDGNTEETKDSTTTPDV